MSKPTQAIEQPTSQTLNDQPTPVKPLRPLTKKQQIFVKYLIDNPKASATAAAREAYNVTTSHSAEVVAHENMRKPEIKLELAKYSGSAESTVVEVMDYSKELGKSGRGAGAQYAGVALQAARDILDRVHGKATQRTEVSTQAVTLNIDLTGTLTSPVTPDQAIQN